MAAAAALAAENCPPGSAGAPGSAGGHGSDSPAKKVRVGGPAASAGGSDVSMADAPPARARNPTTHVRHFLCDQRPLAYPGM